MMAKNPLSQKDWHASPPKQNPMRDGISPLNELLSAAEFWQILRRSASLHSRRWLSAPESSACASRKTRSNLQGSPAIQNNVSANEFLHLTLLPALCAAHCSFCASHRVGQDLLHLQCFRQVFLFRPRTVLSTLRASRFPGAAHPPPRASVPCRTIRRPALDRQFVARNMSRQNPGIARSARKIPQNAPGRRRFEYPQPAPDSSRPRLPDHLLRQSQFSAWSRWLPLFLFQPIRVLPLRRWLCVCGRHATVPGRPRRRTPARLLSPRRTGSLCLPARSIRRAPTRGQAAYSAHSIFPADSNESSRRLQRVLHLPADWLLAVWLPSRSFLPNPSDSSTAPQVS